MALQPPQSLCEANRIFSPINLPSSALLWLWQALCYIHSMSTASIPRGKHHFTQQSLRSLQHPCPLELILLLGEAQQRLWSHCWGCHGFVLAPAAPSLPADTAPPCQSGAVQKGDRVSFLSHPPPTKNPWHGSSQHAFSGLNQLF